MICPNCGQLNREQAKFCRYCGASLAVDASSHALVPVEGAEPDMPGGEKETPATVTTNELPAQAPETRTDTPHTGPGELEQAVPAISTLPHDAPEAQLTIQEALMQRLDSAPDVPVTSELSDAMSRPAALAALPLPAAIADQRYELAGILEQSDERIVYRGYDRLVCGQCAAPRSDPADAFCWQCGAEIGRGALCRAQVGEIPVDASPDSLIVDNGVTYWIAAEAPIEIAPISRLAGLRLRVGYATDPGMVREIDEDSLLVVTGASLIEGSISPNVGLFAIGDGMGGHDDGQVASRRVIQVLARELIPGLLSPALSAEVILEETLEAKVVDAVKRANLELTTEARANNSDMGSTLTLAFVRDQAAIIANVGDSRTYLWQDSALRQITEDHSIVARLAAKGMIQPEEIHTHPRRSEIYRVMGDKPDVEVDVFHCDLRPGTRLVLCCDGVWEMLRTEGIEEVLLTYPDDPQTACDEIVKRSNLAGGEDNISVIVVNVS